jgi:hypothetical protein
MEAAGIRIEEDGVDVDASARRHDVVRMRERAAHGGIGQGGKCAYEERARRHRCQKQLPHVEFTSSRARRSQ